MYVLIPSHTRCLFWCSNSANGVRTVLCCIQCMLCCIYYKSHLFLRNDDCGCIQQTCMYVSIQILYYVCTCEDITILHRLYSKIWITVTWNESESQGFCLDASRKRIGMRTVHTLYRVFLCRVFWNYIWVGEMTEIKSVFTLAWCEWRAAAQACRAPGNRETSALWKLVLWASGAWRCS